MIFAYAKAAQKACAAGIVRFLNLLDYTENKYVPVMVGTPNNVPFTHIDVWWQIAS